MTPIPRRPTSQALLDSLETMLKTRLPATWSVDVKPSDHTLDEVTSRPVPDATLTVRAPDGREANVPVIVKQKLDPRDVSPLVAQIRQMMAPDEMEQPLVLAPYLSRRTQGLLADHGMGQTSPASGIRITLRDPAVFIREDGVRENPWAEPRDQPLRTLRGPTAGRVVRALCDFRPPYGVQDLAERSNTPIGSVSRVLSLLDREALIARVPRGPITEIQWSELIRRWSQDYTFAKANTVGTYLEPRGLPTLLDKLRQTGLRYAVTGSQAASTLAPIAAPRLLSIFVDDLTHASHEFQLRPAERGANVVLAEPFNPVVFDRTRETDGLRHAGPSQVAADLLTGPGRSPAEAEALLQWMKDHEDAWRS